ncbi:MAG: (d)CMP kinase [Desulforhopalus sp.]|nr:(d)CMP kinase [Desulforhopalus sp.]
MSEKIEIITIDGPSGVGKSTVSRKVAAATGFAYLDTGAMYRAVGWYLDRHAVALDNNKAIAAAMTTFVLELQPAADEMSDVGVFVNGENVSQIIRTPEMAMLASRVSALPIIRDILSEIQKAYGTKGRIVAEGRDTGTVIFPNAAYKFFLDAKPEERARRRVAQLARNGVTANLQEILALTRERDNNDQNRAVAPLKKADDAVLIDTTEINLETVVRKILEEVARKRGQ